MMFHTKVFGAIRKFAGLADINPMAAVHSVEVFHNILQRERSRTDRTGDRFSVIGFLARERESVPTWFPLVKVLRQRLRTTDDIGWLDKRQLGVLLPFTEASGAWTVADAISLMFPDDTHPPLCTVYTYPSETSAGNSAGPSAEETDPARPVNPLETFFLQSKPVWKRLLDKTVASMALVLLAPVFFAIAVAIKLTSRGPVFFRQKRSGRGGKPFTIYKFRSMVVDAEGRKKDLMHINEQDGPAFKLKEDPRLTAVGRFLRMTSLDELPQLGNVLCGDMTLVGPRPLPVEETQGCALWQRRRLDVTPGLTCIWQVRGRSQVPFADWIRMDIEYICSISLSLDLKLMMMTLPAVLLRKGAH
jgi:lipopolysaccharide/colanic/teichoic acid biosynthesis glycosyltransferase